MTKIIVKKTEFEDVELMIKNIRLADKIEIEASSGLSFDMAIVESLDISDECWSAFADGKLVAIFGVYITSYMTGHASPWLFSTTEVSNYKREFIRYSKQVSKLLFKDLKYLSNYVDDRNILAKRWLKWLGFTLHDKEPHGSYNLPFRKFTMERGR